MCQRMRYDFVDVIESRMQGGVQLMELSRWEAIDAVRTLSTWGNETGIEDGAFEM